MGEHLRARYTAKNNQARYTVFFMVYLALLNQIMYGGEKGGNMIVTEQHATCYRCQKTLGNNTVHGLHLDCFCTWFDIKKVLDFEDVTAHSTKNEPNEWDRINSSFFHGKFRKYSARLGENTYLLKVMQPELPELPKMEYLCNQIAQRLKLWVPNHFFIHFQNALDTFVCENFMQHYPGSDLVHIYRFLDSPQQFSCEGLLRVIESETKRYDDIQRFVKVCLFDALIGNHDRHGRNLGIIQSPNESRLAPFYDNPSYLAIEDPLLLGAQHEPRGAIVTKNCNEPTMGDYVQEWIRLDLVDPVLEFKQLIDLDIIKMLIHQSPLTTKRQTAFVRLIERRYQELCHAIS